CAFLEPAERRQRCVLHQFYMLPVAIRRRHCGQTTCQASPRASTVATLHGMGPQVPSEPPGLSFSPLGQTDTYLNGGRAALQESMKRFDDAPSQTRGKGSADRATASWTNGDGAVRERASTLGVTSRTRP